MSDLKNADFKSSSRNRLTIFHQNIQCLRQKVGELEIFIRMSLSNFDFLCISEHWMNEDEFSNNFNILSMCPVSVYARKVHRHGGVAIFAKQGLT